MAKWRGPFRKREGSIYRNGGVFLEPNRGVHFAKYRGPFHLEGSISQMGGSILPNGGVHFVKWRGPFAVNGGVRLETDHPFGQMHPSTWQNGEVHLPK